MMSSGVWSTKSSTDLAGCYATKDTEGVTMEAAFKEIGYLGTVSCDYRENPIGAHFELHIEQGPKLEQTGRKVGVVTSVQAMKWFSVRVSGVEGHSGTTPMPVRSDALVTAARLIQSVRDVAGSTNLGVATVGVINNDTQSQATIPSGVEFIIDIRCSTDAMVDSLTTAIFAAFDADIKKEGNETSYHIVRTWGLPESKFDETCIAAVRESALDVLKGGFGTEKTPEELIMDMKSGAGHDSAWTSKVVPTTMIFVPSKDGISHNPNEYTSPEDCALGADVLLGAVLRYDEGLRKVDS
jgi:hydantoinase/carbamoylase family amidase